MSPYQGRAQVYQRPRRILPCGPQPQNRQTKIQQITDIKTLEFLMCYGLKTEVFRIGGKPKFPPIPIEIPERPSLLYFVYAGSYPDEEDLAENGIIATAFAKYYQGLPLKNIKLDYRQEILKQVLESSSYQIFKHKHERKLKLRGMRSD